jgi:hypothetical protein
MKGKVDTYGCKVPKGGTRKGCGGGATVFELSGVAKEAGRRHAKAGGKGGKKALGKVIAAVAEEKELVLTPADIEALSDMVPLTTSHAPAKAEKSGLKLTGAEIRDLGRQIVLRHKNGITIAEITRKIAERHPATPDGTIRGGVWDLAKRFPAEIKATDDGLKPKGK